jgi:hypothetical protein
VPAPAAAATCHPWRTASVAQGTGAALPSKVPVPLVKLFRARRMRRVYVRTASRPTSVIAIGWSTDVKWDGAASSHLFGSPHAFVPEVIAPVAHEPPPASRGAGFRHVGAPTAGTGRWSRRRGGRIGRAAAATLADSTICGPAVLLGLGHWGVSPPVYRPLQRERHRGSPEPSHGRTGRASLHRARHLATRSRQGLCSFRGGVDG